ncbi:hypothetical protein CkaCkLH20_08367 [Colletotrichum karsti]|uniref:Carboxymuconolactone decarboxylase-like domain-containing protein n=1 Tax=Colletotrichum karsti TaxID=1095194 RepID=A0A9P6I1A6_9PEZI|nr:uncharacterized protein CkaCkLH20_08367 [Colletotrichum karsti]KAF9873995.1 hypothetical protein CkaCkLH20_08367 [Colletotrichum karsti]
MARLPYPNVDPKTAPLNILKLLAHTPATANPWSQVGAAQFKDLKLSSKNRELAILLSTSKFRASYEWTHHVPVSTKEGVTDAQRDVLAQAGKQKGFFLRSPPQTADLFTLQEQTLLVFLEAIIDGPQVSEEIWKRAKSEFSDREIVEIITLQVSLPGYSG